MGKLDRDNLFIPRKEKTRTMNKSKRRKYIPRGNSVTSRYNNQTL